MLQGKVGLDGGSRMTQSFFAVHICSISDMRIETLARVTRWKLSFSSSPQFSTFLPTVFPGYMGLSGLLDGILARIASDFSDRYPLGASAHHLLHSFER